MVDSAPRIAPAKLCKPTTSSLSVAGPATQRGTGQPTWWRNLRTLCGCALLSASACTIVADVDRGKIPGATPSPDNSAAAGDAGIGPTDAEVPNASDASTGTDADAAIEDAAVPALPQDASRTADASTAEPRNAPDAGPDAG